MRRLPSGRRALIGGTVTLNSRDLWPARKGTCSPSGAREIGMIFQDPMSSLNLVATVEKQIAEVLMAHEGESVAARREPARELELVGMPDAGRRLDAYPHQLRRRIASAS